MIIPNCSAYRLTRQSEQFPIKRAALKLGIHVGLDDIRADEFYAMLILEEEREALERERLQAESIVLASHLVQTTHVMPGGLFQSRQPKATLTGTGWPSGLTLSAADSYAAASSFTPITWSSTGETLLTRRDHLL